MKSGSIGGNRLVVVADGSAEFARPLAVLLAAEGWRVELAASAGEVREKVVRLRPEVLILEEEMPGNENGALLASLALWHPVTVIGLARRPEAAAGVDCVYREAGDLQTARALAGKLRTAAGNWSRPASRRFAVLGASAGGTEAVEQVLCGLAGEAPGVLVVQHMLPRLLDSFAARLDRIPGYRAQLAGDGDTVCDGVALVAPPDRHMRVLRAGHGWELRLGDGPKLWYQRPSVDVLFDSVADGAAPEAVGAILSGMGQDGAAGLGRMREAGCWTIAQDEATCLVYGMPRAAVAAGAVCETVPLGGIAAAILRRMRYPSL